MQKEKSGTDFSDMLIWLFMQNHQFELAFLQAKAIDKRLKEDGERIFDLADIFLDNSYYNLAIHAFEYIITKGEENTFYIDAHINKLFTYNQMLEKGKNTKEIEDLDKLYLDIIAELGKNRNTISLLSNYAHFKAFYQHNLDEAAEILDEAMLISHLNKSDLAECKLEYADIMLLSGKVWTAILYYSQVEKSFKENPLGHEAKLRRAKIAYYQGDFEWAQAQLDVLKASTSKLIANDAMKLSLLITDNLGLDTSEIPMQTYARADLLFFQNRFSESIITLDSILSSYKGHSLTDEILFKKSEIYLENSEIEKAVEMLKKIETEFFYDILADDAIYTLAEIYQKKLEDKEKAKALYEKILLEFKGSIYTSEARKRFRKLRGDNLERKRKSMIIYNVTINIDKEVETHWLDWMKNTHIPDVMQRELFIDCKISRVLAEETGGHTYAIAYSCKNMHNYEKYQNEFAPKLQAEHTNKFAGKFAAYRTLLEVVHIHE